MKLYVVNTWERWKRNLLEISDCEVVKETEKTYVLTHNRVLKKSDMTLWDGLYAISYDEAVKKAIGYASETIDSCKKKIDELNNTIVRYEKRLLELQGDNHDSLH